MRFFFSLLQSFFLLVVGNKIIPVSELDLPKYMGHWFQVYAAPIDYTFQGYGKCMAADYKILGQNNVSVLNSQYNKKNEYEEISGYAFYKDASKPGELSVTLEGVPVVAPYWVLQLGKVVNDEYQYSIVSVPVGPSLWVLARDVNDFFQTYNDDVISFLDEHNFRYVKVEQDC
jgi:lipocalin